MAQRKTVRRVCLPVDDPQVRQPEITRAQQVLVWEPEVEVEEDRKRMLSRDEPVAAARPVPRRGHRTRSSRLKARDGRLPIR